VNGYLPGLQFPLTPGHEIAGRIDAVGEGVEDWPVGTRVAVGWFGGNCGHCTPCRRGDFVDCVNLQVPGLSYPGGYADSVVVPVAALARIPDGLTPVEAAPLSCAGVTVFNALRNGPARAGDLVAVLGLGGLGHLAVQFAAKMGFDTVVIARGAEKAPFSVQLGARHYIDSTVEDVPAALQDLGGASTIIATAASSDAMSVTFDGLAARGALSVVGTSLEPLSVNPIQYINGSRQSHGVPAGSAQDVEDTLKFAELSGVRAVVEQLPLEAVQQGYDRMVENKARFRVVLTTGRA
jgi:alcohol dehydrogenase